MKKWYRSKTLWINGLTLVITVATFLIAGPVGLSPMVLVGVTSLLSVANILLRFVTNSPLANYLFYDDSVKRYTMMDVPEANRHYTIIEKRQ